MSHEQKPPQKFDKVDRAIEMQVIDWLQWYEFPYDPKNPNIVELALELIQKRKKENEQLRADLQTAIEALEKYSNKANWRYWSNHDVGSFKEEWTMWKQNCRGPEIADETLAKLKEQT